MNGIEIFNAVEAAWWILLALTIPFLPFPATVRWSRFPLALVLLLFGLSDVVEIWTGAWWRPWWLGVWKGTCVLAIGLLGIAIVRGRRKR